MSKQYKRFLVFWWNHYYDVEGLHGSRATLRGAKTMGAWCVRGNEEREGFRIFDCDERRFVYEKLSRRAERDASPEELAGADI